MRRILPCPAHGAAQLKDGSGKLFPYEMGRPPSAFSTAGKAFEYVCMGCARPAQREGMTLKNAGSGRLSITKSAFYALSDLDAPVVARPGFEPESSGRKPEILDH